MGDDRRAEGLGLGGTYKCEHCKGVFDSAWTEEEALAEADENFAGEDDKMWDEAPAVVCDDCYHKLIGSPVPQ